MKPETLRRNGAFGYKLQKYKYNTKYKKLKINVLSR
jgi:hypothetical protein